MARQRIVSRRPARSAQGSARSPTAACRARAAPRAPQRRTRSPAAAPWARRRHHPRSRLVEEQDGARRGSIASSVTRHRRFGQDASRRRHHTRRAGRAASVCVDIRDRRQSSPIRVRAIKPPSGYSMKPIEVARAAQVAGSAAVIRSAISWLSKRRGAAHILARGVARRDLAQLLQRL